MAREKKLIIPGSKHSEFTRKKVIRAIRAVNSFPDALKILRKDYPNISSADAIEVIETAYANRPIPKEIQIIRSAYFNVVRPFELNTFQPESTPEERAAFTKEYKKIKPIKIPLLPSHKKKILENERDKEAVRCIFNRSLDYAIDKIEEDDMKAAHMREELREQTKPAIAMKEKRNEKLKSLALRLKEEGLSDRSIAVHINKHWEKADLSKYGKALSIEMIRKVIKPQ
jgi:hypothetical protein